MRLNIKALTIAVALVWGGAVLIVELLHLIWPSYGGAFLGVIASIYPGYHATGSLWDMVKGLGYAVVDGGIGGLVFAWLYNLLISKRPTPESRLSTQVPIEPK